MNRIRTDLLPEAGYVIAQLKSILLFEPYDVKDGKLLFHGSDCLEKEPIAACHFFSRDREYRLVVRESQGDVIERVLTEAEEEAMDPDLIYRQEMLVKKEYACRKDLPEKLLVINRYDYTENDTLTLRDYRISFP